MQLNRGLGNDQRQSLYRRTKFFFVNYGQSLLQGNTTTAHTPSDRST